MTLVPTFQVRDGACDCAFAQGHMKCHAPLVKQNSMPLHFIFSFSSSVQIMIEVLKH